MKGHNANSFEGKMPLDNIPLSDDYSSALKMLLGDSKEDAISFRYKFDFDTRSKSIRNAIMAGILPLIFATRAECETYKDFLDCWDETASSIKNHSATYGELLIMYCVQPWCDRAGYDEVDTNKFITAIRKEGHAYYNNFTEDYNDLYKERLFDEVRNGNYDLIFKSKPLKDFFNTVSEQRNSIVSAPYWLAKEMVEKLPLSCGMTVLDLSCNLGFFLVASLVKFRSLGCDDADILQNLFGIDIDIKKLYITAALIKPYDYDVPTLAFSQTVLPTNIQGFFGMPKYDVVVGNPPYNTPRNIENNYSQDLYPYFIDLGARLSPLVSMVTPSRWLVKSGTLNKNLRQKMTSTYGLVDITTIDSKNAFGIKIEGGVSYFVLNRNHNGETTFDGKVVDMASITNKHKTITISDDPRVDKALELIENVGSVQSMFHGDSTFGIKTNYSKKNGIMTSGVPCLFSKQKGGMGYVNPSDVKNTNLIDKWKVVFQAANGAAGPRLKNTDVLKIDPGTIVSQSYVFFAFNTEVERDSFFDYISSDVVLDLIAVCKQTQHVNRMAFSLVPNIRDTSLLVESLVQEEEAA